MCCFQRGDEGNADNALHNPHTRLQRGEAPKPRTHRRATRSEQGRTAVGRQRPGGGETGG
eukprot:CAMPEP_0196689920 /NCGR_PEP_ID=MMETSP1090-20130531/19347_1 /TAXON_ID=37098 /ORGANISM="Isochrysis sp, Strain CCMP1244" /LENGTH=59 /DNA_ID=CAMNT_0042028985 /DNA_START=129 /DNA_END=305 /DNA_ORIENTATION=-